MAVRQFDRPLSSRRLHVQGISLGETFDGIRENAIWIKQLNSGRIRLTFCVTSIVWQPSEGSDFTYLWDNYVHQAYNHAFARFVHGDYRPLITDPPLRRLTDLAPSNARSVIAVCVEMDRRLRIRIARISKGNFRSAGHLSYHQADAILAAGEGEMYPMLHEAEQLAVALQAQRGKCGAINDGASDFGTVKCEPNSADANKGLSRLPANQIMQELSILINQVVAEYCLENSIPTLYRNMITEGPETCGVYGIEPQRHEGLKLSACTHFTNPLRRGADGYVQLHIRRSLEKWVNPSLPSEVLQDVVDQLNEVEQRIRSVAHEKFEQI